MLQSTGNRMEERVVQAAEEELRSLSGAEPRLPWSAGGGRKQR